MEQRTKSEILEAVLQTVKGLHQSGVMDVETKRDFESLCLLKPLPEEVNKHMPEKPMN